MRVRIVLVGLALVLALGACGRTLGEQALFGAGAGAVGAAAVGGDLATGAVVGGAGNVAFCQMYPHQCR